MGGRLPQEPRGEKVTTDTLIDAVRTGLIGWMTAHQRECGHPDCAEPVNVLAFLAHAVGLKDSQVEEFRKRLDDYNRHCPNCTQWN